MFERDSICSLSHPASPKHALVHNVDGAGERESVFLWRLFFPLVAIVYIGHYYLFDHPMRLQPDALWFRFRFSIAAL